jgi:hypothetical protein
VADLCNINSFTNKSFKMKKLILYSISAFLIVLFIPAQMKAGTRTSAPSKDATTIAATKTVESAEAQVLLTRLDEIKAMDMTTLNATERKELRKEVRSIKSQLSDMGHGVYLSAGAIIIIILLLILLL